MSLKSLSVKLGLLAGLALTTTAVSASDATVELVFDEYLSKRMDSISRIDKQREKVFRKFRRDGSRQAQRPRDSLNNSRFFNTEWGNERLIPDLDDYSVPALITEMMMRGIKEADSDFDGRVVLEVTNLNVANFPLAAIQSFNSRMEGSVKMYDASGKLIAEHDVWTAIVPNFSASRNYKGPDYAYRGTAAATRVGPVAAEFTEDALNKLFPDYDAPGAVFLTSAEF